MDETGGDIQDYVKLNQDFSKYDDISVLREYYKQTKPHLTDDEISFVMEDTFSYDEDEHTEKEIRRNSEWFHFCHRHTRHRRTARSRRTPGSRRRINLHHLRRKTIRQ